MSEPPAKQVRREEKQHQETKLLPALNAFLMPFLQMHLYRNVDKGVPPSGIPPIEVAVGALNE
jgi:hypothetical protein